MTNINDSEPISPQYSLRLPIELREKLTNAAKSNSHSLNKEIIIRLEQSLILEKCPECVKYLQTVKNHEKIFEEQYKMFEELNKKDKE
ncbi:MAG: Arc family DNA-binding protein [Acinetobacter calcoaceticus]